MSEFYLKMISSNGVFYEGMCNSLIVPAPDGERAVMAHHEELMIAVTEGEARFRKQEGEDFSCVVVGRGYDQSCHGKSPCRNQGNGKICRALMLVLSIWLKQQKTAAP